MDLTPASADVLLAALLRDVPRLTFYGQHGEELSESLTWRVAVRPGQAQRDERGGVQVAALEADAPQHVVEGAMARGRGCVKRHKVELYQRDEHTVVLRHSGLRTGRASATSTKTYARWDTMAWQQVRVLPDGRWLVTERYGRPGSRGYCSTYQYADSHRADSPVSVLLPAPVSVREFSSTAVALFAPHGQEDPHDLRVPAYLLRRFAGAHDVPTLTRQLFGTRAYRKDLARALGQLLTDRATARQAPERAHGRLALAWIMRDMVPVDWLVAVLRGQGTPATQGVWWPDERQVANLRRHLRQLDLRSRRRLVLGTGTQFGPGAYDVARAAVVPGLTRVDSWEDLHDQVLPPGAAVQMPQWGSQTDMARAQAEDFAPKITDLHRALDGTTPAGRTVVVATCGQQVRAWAAQMHHCIASYQMPMFLGHCVLGAVLDVDGTMLGNFEVRVARDEQARLAQLLGPRNATLPREILADVEEHLRVADVAVAGYWGRHGQAAA